MTEMLLFKNIELLEYRLFLARQQLDSRPAALNLLPADQVILVQGNLRAHGLIPENHRAQKNHQVALGMIAAGVTKQSAKKWNIA